MGPLDRLGVGFGNGRRLLGDDGRGLGRGLQLATAGREGRQERDRVARDAMRSYGRVLLGAAILRMRATKSTPGARARTHETPEAATVFGVRRANLSLRER